MKTTLSLSLLLLLISIPVIFNFRFNFKQNNFFSKRVRTAHSLSNDNYDIIPFSNLNFYKPNVKVISSVLLLSYSLAMSAKSSLASGYDFSSNDTLNVNLNDFVTSKVYFNIKIANYTEESTGTNKGAIGSGRIVIGLFGNDAPKATSLFLSTIQANPDEYPSYLNAQFLRINEENGLLQMEKLRGLDTVNIGGNEQYEYKNKILTDYKPFVEVTKFKHSRKGLLSRKQFTSGPEFSITTIPCENELDQFHEVFGIVLEGYDVLDAIASIPRYTYKTKTGYASSTKGQDGIIADAWFESQKKFYVGIGKSFGDKRAVDQRGKLLRRVQVIGCGELK